MSRCRLTARSCLALLAAALLLTSACGLVGGGDAVEVEDLLQGYKFELRGRDHVFELANAAFLQLVGHRDLVGGDRAVHPEQRAQLGPVAAVALAAPSFTS